MSYDVHFIVEFVMNTGIVAHIRGQEQQVVARYERVLEGDDAVSHLPQLPPWKLEKTG